MLKYNGIYIYFNIYLNKKSKLFSGVIRKLKSFSQYFINIIIRSSNNIQIPRERESYYIIIPSWISVMIIIRNIRIEEYWIFLVFSKVLSSNKDLSDIKFILINLYITIFTSSLQIINSSLLFSTFLLILQVSISNTHPSFYFIF